MQPASIRIVAISAACSSDLAHEWLLQECVHFVESLLHVIADAMPPHLTGVQLSKLQLRHSYREHFSSLCSNLVSYGQLALSAAPIMWYLVLLCQYI